jgi:hypothetical protein
MAVAINDLRSIWFISSSCLTALVAYGLHPVLLDFAVQAITVEQDRRPAWPRARREVRAATGTPAGEAVASCHAAKDRD